MNEESTSTLFLEQLLAGTDYAKVHPAAGQTATFAYLVGCREAGECLAVDPTWDPRGVIAIAEENGLHVVGGIATHGHPDHVGGQWMGMNIPGLREFAGINDGPIHVHSQEVYMVRALTDLPDERLAAHEEGDVIEVGEVRIEVLHTPGHSPGSITLLVDGHALTGDVLFVGGCGRVDLPGADPTMMRASLERLSKLPGETVVLPGHDYGMAVRSTIAEEIRSNPIMHAVVSRGQGR
jgi:glyoxylase-like metal-dependent hydrolase (beta-lactamase superfamily II)